MSWLDSFNVSLRNAYHAIHIKSVCCDMECMAPDVIEFAAMCSIIVEFVNEVRRYPTDVCINLLSPRKWLLRYASSYRRCKALNKTISVNTTYAVSSGRVSLEECVTIGVWENMIVNVDFALGQCIGQCVHARTISHWQSWTDCTKNMKCIQHMQQGMRVVGLEEPVRMGQRHRREPCFILAHQLMYSYGTCYVACVCEIRELCHQNGIAHDCTCVIIKCTCVDLVYMIWPQHPFPLGHRHMYKWVYRNLYAE
jgi:hypothetical protein